MSQAYEKLGAFYLGKTFDLDAGAPAGDLLLFDSNDLTTHGAIFGMTGSGKTGLGVCLLEEALIDGLPVIAIDPKGDLTNLLLNFPDLRPEDFRPWVQEGEARRQGLTRDEFAAQQAALWRDGLARWDQSGERIRRLRDAAEMAIYTPGSEAGLPVSMLKSFAAPSEQLRHDREQMREYVQAAATSLLGLLKRPTDPLNDKATILISLLLDRSWQAGQDLTLPDLIRQIQSPGIERVGVFDLDTFFPPRERMDLAMAINNLLAAPGFEAWVHGEPLDLDRLLHSSSGKPRLAIFSIAHLGDAERMFFVSQLLGETLSWMRRQPGTSTLRALLYMDEIYGYLPPTANPPSKQPLMTLMKTARAFGLGLVVATQNPKDLDYKALSNAGAWFIGRLQTDRDRDRLLDGLEAAAAGSGAPFDRGEMERRIAGLGKRVFLLYNVHDKAPTAFQTRWALSYLSGPLTREQIERLMGPRKAGAGGARPALAANLAAVAASAPPALPPDVPQYFAPVRAMGPAGARLEYRPALAGVVRAHYQDRGAGVDEAREIAAVTPILEGPAPVDWQAARDFELDPSALETSARAEQGVWFAPLHADAAKARSYTAWSRAFVNWAYTERPLELFRSAALKETSRPGENERDFRVRLDLRAREERDRRRAQLAQKCAPRMTQLEERLRRARQAAEAKKEQAGARKMQAAISVGATLLGAFFGRKAVSASNVQRVGAAARSLNRMGDRAGDVARAEENVEAVEARIAELEAEFQRELAAAAAAIDPLAEPLETIRIAPKKTTMEVRFCGLVWLPYWAGPAGAEPAWD